MALFEDHLPLKEEETDAFEDWPAMETFMCSLCGFKFSQEKYLTNHFNLCKNIENPLDRMGAPIDPQCKSPKEEEQSAELLDQKSTSDPLLDIKIEMDLDFSETIPDSNCLLSGKPVEILKTSEEPTQFEDHIKVYESPETTQKSTKSGFIPARYRFLKTYKGRHTGKESGKVGVVMRTVEKPFNCEICDYSSTCRDHFQQHMLKHRPEMLFFNCEICNYCSKRRDDLQRHMLKHNSEKTFNCEICDFTSTRHHDLQQHMLNAVWHTRHIVEKTFFCKICDYASTHKGTFKHHILTHSLEKPFNCEMGDYASIRRNTLQRRMLKHTGRRQFNCDICDYTSVRRHYLQRHMLKHRVEKKTFMCKICDYAGPRRADLQRHMLTHTVRKLFM